MRPISQNQGTRNSQTLNVEDTSGQAAEGPLQSGYLRAAMSLQKHMPRCKRASLFLVILRGRVVDFEKYLPVWSTFSLGEDLRSHRPKLAVMAFPTMPLPQMLARQQLIAQQLLVSIFAMVHLPLISLETMLLIAMLLIAIDCNVFIHSSHLSSLLPPVVQISRPAYCGSI